VVVQDLDEPDLRFVELQSDMQRMIEPAFVDFVPLERRTDEHRQRQLALTSHDLGEGKHRPRTRAFAARADDDDDGVVRDECDDLIAALFQRARRQRGIVPRSETLRRGSADDEPFLDRHLLQRELVGIEKPRGDRAAEPIRVGRIGLLRDGNVAREQCLQRTQDISAATASAQ